MFDLACTFRLRKRPERGKTPSETTLWKKLQNPFALVAQGFLVGGALFWTTQAEAAPFLAALFCRF